MIQFSRTIPAIDKTISEPVARSIIRELLSLLHIDKENIVTNTLVDSEFINDHWSVGKTNNRNIAMKSATVEFKFSEEFTPERLSITRTRSNDRKPVFLDKAGLGFQPLSIETESTITITIQDKNETEVKRIANLLRLYFTTDRTHNLHSILYKYYLPDGLIHIIKEANDIRNEALNKELTLTEYITEMSDSRMTLVSNIAGDISSLSVAFKEIQEDVLGGFVTDISNAKAEYDKDIGKWTLDIEYKYTYDKIAYLNTFFEISYYNKLFNLNKDILESFNPNKHTNATEIQKALSCFNVENGIYRILKQLKGNRYIHIPNMDIYKDYTDTIGTPIFSALILLEKDNPTHLFNLMELGDYSIESNLLQFIIDGEYQYITKHLESIVNIVLYKDGKKVTDNVLSVTENLDVYVKEPLDIASRYRVLFQIIDRVSLLSYEAQERFSRVKRMIENKLALVSNTLQESGFICLPTLYQNANSELLIKNIVEVERGFINKTREEVVIDLQSSEVAFEAIFKYDGSDIQLDTVHNNIESPSTIEIDHILDNFKTILYELDRNITLIGYDAVSRKCNIDSEILQIGLLDSDIIKIKKFIDGVYIIDFLDGEFMVYDKHRLTFFTDNDIRLDVALKKTPKLGGIETVSMEEQTIQEEVLNGINDGIYTISSRNGNLIVFSHGKETVDNAYVKDYKNSIFLPTAVRMLFSSNTDKAIMKTVQESSIIAYAMREINKD